MKQISNITLLAIGLLFILTGCDKTERYQITKPEPLAHFISSNPNVNYYVRNAATDSFVVQVGTTDVSSVDRSVTFNVTSPTGAVNGTDYAISSPASGNSIVIKAGTVVSSITVKGKFAAFATGKKHTLYFTLAQPSVAVAKFSDTVKLAMQRYCDVVPSALTGVYKKAFDIQTGQPTYGPYTVNIPTAVATSTGATTGYVMISNFWDVGGADIRVNLDWTNPASFITNVPAQFLYTDPTYGAATITGVGNGSFSSCDNTFSISYSVTVSAGSFGNFTTTIAR
jgi:hypothetical protein